MRRKTHKRFVVGKQHTGLKFSASPQKAKFKKILYITGIALLAYFFMFGNRGLIRLLKLKQERIVENNDILRLQDEIVKKQREKEMLLNDMNLIEDIARQELGLVKKGEIVYKFINPEQNKQNEEKKK